MAKLTIKLLAFPEAPETVYNNGKQRLMKLLPAEKFMLTNAHPEILFFLTGGSERMAIEHIRATDYKILIGSQHDNGYASATEVKAYLDSRNINSLLLDEEEETTVKFLHDLLSAKQALENLRGKKTGLIGKVSDWLVASGVSSSLLKEKMGIELIEIPWTQIPHYSDCEPSETFLRSFPDTNKFDLTETAKVSRMLSDTIQQYDLDAITVECFPMVRKDLVTACLPLACLNDQGFPAGCEGDITAIAGMLLCKELTGIVPWIANINKVTKEGCLFSHCTIAPGLVSDYSITTHFETGKGTAIQGRFKNDIVTIFRFDNTFSKAFIATAPIKNRPKLPAACRTQIEVMINENEVRLLKEKPLGNHHLIYPGDCSEMLQLICKVAGIEVLK